jgi:hypothetical protein
MAPRDGAYLLPSGADREQALQDLAEECTREGGSTWLMAVQPRSADEVRIRAAPCVATAHQGRTWATRRRLWVDRVASAWLIRRFIDRKARFR